MVLFEGLLNGDVRVNLLGVLHGVHDPGIGKGDMKKLCGVAMELLDNAQRYGSGPIAFEWSMDEISYSIKVVNHASEVDANRLIDAVAQANTLGPAELKTKLLEELTNGRFGVKGGAGLGFLQIANRTHGDMKATIHPLEEKLYRCESTFNLKKA